MNLSSLKKALFFVFFFCFLLTSPAVVRAEKINDFQTNIIINKSGTISVTEKIVYDFETAYRHGIFRYLPTTWKNSEGKKFKLDYKNISIADEKNAPYNYSTSNVDENIKFQIGDAGRTITGVHTYVINYGVNGLVAYSDHDELYRNITGHDWPAPIEKASVSVSLPENISIDNIRTACYVGSIGSTTTDSCQVEKTPEKTTFTTGFLSTGQGITIVFGFPKNLITIPEPQPVVSFWETLIGKIVSFLFVCLGIFWYFLYPIWIIVKWFKFGRDPKPIVGEVSAWYDPPKTKSGRFLTPIEVGALVDESVDMRDISSMIVDLARRGYFVIEEKKKGDFYFVRRSSNEGGSKKQKDQLIDFEKKLIQDLFTFGNSVRLKDVEMVTTVEEIKKMVYEDLVKEGYFPKNPQSTRTFYYVIGGLALFTANFFLAAVAFIFGRVMPVKTQLGSDSAMVGKSLKNFLSSQERQLEFLVGKSNLPAGRQVMFERLLPFAIAFGVEKIWANRFKDIALKQPSWYQGYDNRVFTSYLLVNSLNSSFSTFKSVATPTRSSSGFSSGFSGGFSGGGSGGGGGGSW